MLDKDEFAQAAVKTPVKILKVKGSGASATYEVQVIAGAGDRLLELAVGREVCAWPAHLDRVLYVSV